ncbi:MAG: hypothetical protein WCA00_06365 [Candidatus Acidiferrales bacterium]
MVDRSPVILGATAIQNPPRHASRDFRFDQFVIDLGEFLPEIRYLIQAG